MRVPITTVANGKKSAQSGGQPADAQPAGARRSPESKDLIALAAAATTLTSVVAGLAVTGALQQMQLNHGMLLMSAFALVLLAAAVWAIPAVWRVAPKVESVMITIAVSLFLGGVLLGIGGMIMTQRDQERPSVAASLDEETFLLTATATAHNLGTDDRLVTEVTALEPTARSEEFEVVRHYLAITGPDADGKASQHFTKTIPSGTHAVGVGASIGNDTGCFDETIGGTTRDGADPTRTVSRRELERAAAAAVVPDEQPGCVVIFLP
jgi:hypothetical protein